MNFSEKITLKTKIALLTTVFLWSSAFVGIRIGLAGYSPGSLALFRFLIASLFLFLICFFIKEKQKIIFKDKIKLMCFGVLTVAGYHIALNYGELHVSAGTASFIISQSPVITSVLAIIFLKEKIPTWGILGMIVSVLGVILILFSQPGQINFTTSSIFILIATVLGSLYSVLQKPFLKKYHSIEVASYLVYGATLSLLFYSLSLHDDLLHSSFKATMACIYLGIFPAAVAYLAWGYALSKISTARAINYLYWMPIITSLLGWLFLKEAPTFFGITGGLIALLGVFILDHSYKKAVAPALVEEVVISKK